MDLLRFGFDPTQYTAAPLQTEGWIEFTGPADQVFERLAQHEAMTEWVPLLEKVTVMRPPAGINGESAVGTTRRLEFQGGVTLIEHVVYWNPPLCYAYDAEGSIFPLRDYIALMGVQQQPGGGRIIFREYYSVSGRIQNTVIPHGVALLMRRAFHSLSRVIGGTDFDVKHVGAAG